MGGLESVTGFDWEEGNSRKSTDKHGVSQAEAEQVFLNEPLFVLSDTRHSQQEPRFHALGHTDMGRPLHITFTLRGENKLIRVISARTMHRKGREFMTKKVKKIPPLATEAAERKFWEKHDSTSYIDWNQARSVRLAELRPSTTAISIRLPSDLLEQIKTSANRRDVPYQSLIKLWLAEKMKEVRGGV
jgi:uncharacterized protein